MTGNYVVGLNNAIDALLSFWANAWNDMLDADDPPDQAFWDALAADLTIANDLAQTARTR